MNSKMHLNGKMHLHVVNLTILNISSYYTVVRIHTTVYWRIYTAEKANNIKATCGNANHEVQTFVSVI